MKYFGIFISVKLGLIIAAFISYYFTGVDFEHVLRSTILLAGGALAMGLSIVVNNILYPSRIDE